MRRPESLVTLLAAVALIIFTAGVARKPQPVKPPYTLTGAVCTFELPSGNPMIDTTPICNDLPTPGDQVVKLKGCTWERRA